MLAEEEGTAEASEEGGCNGWEVEKRAESRNADGTAVPHPTCLSARPSNEGVLYLEYPSASCPLIFCATEHFY